MKAPDETRERVLQALDEVHDPEIPAVSIVQMGMLARVEVEDARVRIELTRTFVGCPALELIRRQVRARVAVAVDMPESRVEVEFGSSVEWTTDRISSGAHPALREIGIAPLPPREGDAVVCPFCGSADTVLENPFGPTPCRNIHYCRSCRNPFESFKRI